MTQLKKIVKSAIHALCEFASGTRIGRYLMNEMLQITMERVQKVSYGGVTLSFPTPNSLCEWRAKTFATKEPETLEWIDSLPENSILWDVGANIGLYSVYAAKKKNCRVWAFEPSVFNLELLARSISANQLTDLICVVPIALSDRLAPSNLRMTSTQWGGALSTFGQDFGWDGKSIRPVFSFQTLGLSMEDAVNRLHIPAPEFIKMDVDGLEHYILQGGPNILKNAKGILIEINDDFAAQAEQCKRLLDEAGLVLKEKRHSEIISSSTFGFQHSYNQIWVRP
jgi:FkbM family methyltransferase